MNQVEFRIKKRCPMAEKAESEVTVGFVFDPDWPRNEQVSSDWLVHIA